MQPFNANLCKLHPLPTNSHSSIPVLSLLLNFYIFQKCNLDPEIEVESVLRFGHSDTYTHTPNYSTFKIVQKYIFLYCLCPIHAKRAIEWNTFRALLDFWRQHKGEGGEEHVKVNYVWPFAILGEWRQWWCAGSCPSASGAARPASRSALGWAALSEQSN